MPQNSWLQGENSFLQGIDAGNRMFESIADVQAKQFALESAKTELPLRLMDLQLSQQQRMQSLKIQQEEFPVKMAGMKLNNQQDILAIKSRELDIQTKLKENEDKAAISNYFANVKMGEQVPEPTLNTPGGLAFFNQAKASSDFGQKQLEMETYWKSNTAKLTPSQFAEVTGMPRGENGMPTPAALGRMDSFLKMNQEEAAKLDLKTYTDKQDAMGERQKALIESKNEGRLAEVNAKMRTDFENHSDPFIKRQYLAGVAAINADPSIQGAEAKIAAQEKLRAKLLGKNPEEKQASAWDQRQITVIDDKLGKLADQRVALLIEDPTGKSSSTRKKIQAIDEQRKALEVYKQSLGGSTQSGGADEGIMDFDPSTRTIKGGPAKTKESMPPDQGPEYDRALDGNKGSDMVGSIVAKTKSTSGAEKEYVFQPPKSIEGFVGILRKLDPSWNGDNNKKQEVQRSAKAAFFEEYALMFGIEDESIGGSRIKRSARSIAQDLSKKKPEEISRLINALPDESKAEFWKNVADRVNKNPKNGINSMFDWSWE